EGSNIIGRSSDADLRLPDTGVSRQHAEITWDGRDAILVDLKSTNGTTVNDTPVENWLLADGDVITVGHFNIEVRIVSPYRERVSMDSLVLLGLRVALMVVQRLYVLLGFRLIET